MDESMVVSWRDLLWSAAVAGGAVLLGLVIHAILLHAALHVVRFTETRADDALVRSS
jgi:hypothetical protein